MNIDVAACISDLLYTRDVVTIPGMGDIVSSYKPASFDYVHGVLYPPSRQLSFHANTRQDDNTLSLALQQKYGLNEGEAIAEVRSFIRNLQDKITDKGMVTLDKIGNIYVDHNQEIRFIDDSLNYNRDAYGLPALHYFPIHQQPKKQEVELVSVGPAMMESRPPSLLQKRLLPLFIPIIFAAAVTIIGFSIFINQKNAEALLGIEQLPLERHFNENPSHKAQNGNESSTDNRDRLARASIIPTYQEKGLPAGDKVNDQDDADLFDTEGPTLAPNQHECVIIIGQFSKKEGVSKRVNEIYEIGFNAYTAKNPQNGLTMVGVQFIYEDPEDVHKALKYLRRKFEVSAWVLKPESF